MNEPIVSIQVKESENEEPEVTFCFSEIEAIFKHGTGWKNPKSWYIEADDAIALGEYLIAIGKIAKKRKSD